MWKHRILYLAAAATALIIYIVADRREALALLCLIIIIPVFCALLQGMAMQAVQVRCHARKSCRIGLDVPVVFTLKRKNALPMGVIHCSLTSENYLFRDTEKAELYFQPEEKKDMVFRYLMKAKNCGEVKLTAGLLEFYDILGLFKWKKKIRLDAAVSVYPAELQLHAQLMRRPQTKSYGEMYDQYKKGRDVSEVSDIRDYAEGDSLSSMHWKLSGKLDRLMVREFGDSANYNTLILYEIARQSGKEVISDDCNNAVLALTSALSYGLMELSVEHSVGREYYGDIRTVPVRSLGNHEEMEKLLLCMPILEDAAKSMTPLTFLRANMYQQYTKVIYIASSYNESFLRQLANEVDLTVICAVEGKNLNYTSSAQYSILPVNTENYQENVHNIAI